MDRGWIFQYRGWPPRTVQDVEIRINAPAIESLHQAGL